MNKWKSSPAKIFNMDIEISNRNILPELTQKSYKTVIEYRYRHKRNKHVWSQNKFECNMAVEFNLQYCLYTSN
jgi:hypothetical protein